MKILYNFSKLLHLINIFHKSLTLLMFYFEISGNLYKNKNNEKNIFSNVITKQVLHFNI